MRPTTLQDRRPGTSADVPDVPSRSSMVAIADAVTEFELFRMIAMIAEAE